MDMPDKPIWERPLESLNDAEWEQLCDGCGRCCLKKIEDEGSGELQYTRVVCRYFDQASARCNCYDSRTVHVPDCLRLREQDLSSLYWIPSTCAYKLRAENKPLPEWHPLIYGSRELMEREGVAITGRVLSEENVHPDGLQEHVIRWVEADGKSD